MISSRLKGRHGLLSKIGTFWYRNTTPDTQSLIRSVLGLSQSVTAPSSIQAAAANAAGSSVVVEENITLTFRTPEVTYIGPDIQKRFVTKFGDGGSSRFILARADSSRAMLTNLDAGDSEYLTTEDGAYVLLPSEDDAAVTLDAILQRWAVPAVGCLPLAIATATRDLVLGIDYTAGVDCLIFSENPSTLFPNNKILTRACLKTCRALLSYTWQVDQAPEGGVHIARYLRDTQSPKQFGLAVAEAAGFRIMPEDAVVRQVIPLRAGCRYIFDQGAIDAVYPHTPLQAGDELAQHDVIGSPVRLFAAGGASWYRGLDWSEGLSLDQLCQFNGIIVPDRPCRVHAVSQDTGGLHVRIELEGNAEAIDKFWQHIWAGEIRSGRYLNSAIGLQEVGGTSFLNPLDFYFDNLLGARAMVLKFDPAVVGTGYHKRALTFIQREKPVGCIPIVL